MELALFLPRRKALSFDSPSTSKDVQVQASRAFAVSRSSRPTREFNSRAPLVSELKQRKTKNGLVRLPLAVPANLLLSLPRKFPHSGSRDNSSDERRGETEA